MFLRCSSSISFLVLEFVVYITYLFRVNFVSVPGVGVVSGTIFQESDLFPTTWPYTLVNNHTSQQSWKLSSMYVFISGLSSLC